MKFVKNKYVIIVTYHSVHSIHGYIIGITAVCSMVVIYHVKFTTTCQFYMNTISYMHAMWLFHGVTS